MALLPYIAVWCIGWEAKVVPWLRCRNAWSLAGSNCDVRGPVEISICHMCPTHSVRPTRALERCLLKSSTTSCTNVNHSRNYDDLELIHVRFAFPSLQYASMAWCFVREFLQMNSVSSKWLDTCVPRVFCACSLAKNTALVHRCSVHMVCCLVLHLLHWLPECGASDAVCICLYVVWNFWDCTDFHVLV